MFPYVISADIFLLLGVWALERGFTLPPKAFFQSLRQTFCNFFRKIFPNFQFISEDELQLGIQKIVSESGFFPISLEKTYFPTSPNLEICRHTSCDNTEKGLGPRPNSPSLEEQINRLEAYKDKKIILIDDVIFTGELLLMIFFELSRRGFHVEMVVAGIGIQQGIKELEKAGLKVHCVRVYQEVVDEICERDFYPGVPLSGRLLNGGGDNIGMPYILPFGKPGDWASIPENWQKAFSIFCIHQTISLFEAIEKASGNKKISCQEVGRKVFSLPQDGSSFVEALKRTLL
jgi:hypothetical protein